MNATTHTAASGKAGTKAKGTGGNAKGKAKQSAPHDGPVPHKLGIDENISITSPEYVKELEEFKENGTVPGEGASQYRVAGGKKEGKAAVTADIFQSTLTLNFSTGDTLELNADTLSPEIKHAAMMHGLKQKLIDAAAIGRDIVTGLSATPKDKYNAVRHVYERLTASEGATWNKGREEGAGPSVGGLLAAALMELSGKDRETIAAYLETLSNEQKAALRSSDKVAPVIARLKAQQGKAKSAAIDTDALLSQLG